MDKDSEVKFVVVVVSLQLFQVRKCIKLNKYEVSLVHIDKHVQVKTK